MFGPPSVDEITLNYTLEYDARSPRLRTTILAYMMEHGAGPEQLGIKSFLEYAQAMAEWVASDREEFFEAVEEVAVIAEDGDTLNEDSLGETEDSSGYNYL